MIGWLCEAFGFELRPKVEGDHGRIEHSELAYNEAVPMRSAANGAARAAGFENRSHSGLVTIAPACAPSGPIHAAATTGTP
jgi:uncharacterized glyoxalase superfamily protein PhnB